MAYWPHAGDLSNLHITLYETQVTSTQLCLPPQTTALQAGGSSQLPLHKPFHASKVVFSRGQVPSHNLQWGCKLAGPDYIHVYRQPYQGIGVKTLAQILNTFPKYVTLLTHITPEKRLLFELVLVLNLALCFLHQYKITGLYIQFTQIHSIPLVSMVMYGYKSAAQYWVIISVYSDLKSYFSFWKRLL